MNPYQHLCYTTILTQDINGTTKRYTTKLPLTSEDIIILRDLSIKIVHNSLIHPNPLWINIDLSHFLFFFQGLVNE